MLLRFAILAFSLSFLAVGLSLADDFSDGLKFTLRGNHEQAAGAFRKSAEAGNSEAQFKIGLMYEEGRGVAQDYAQAAAWYLKAAELNHTHAQFRLGKLLMEGKGVSLDRVEAYKWFSIANEKDQRGAKMDLSKLGLTKAQVDDAKLRVKKWHFSKIPHSPSKNRRPTNEKEAAVQ